MVYLLQRAHFKYETSGQQKGVRGWQCGSGVQHSQDPQFDPKYNKTKQKEWGEKAALY